MNGRRTGRTFRLLLQSLIAASDGEKVAFVCGSPGLTFYRNRCLAISRSYLTYEFCSTEQNKLVFKNGGSIEFVYAQDTKNHLGRHNFFVDDSA